MESNLERVDTQVGAIEAGGKHVNDILQDIMQIEELVGGLAVQLGKIQQNTRSALSGVEEMSAVAQQSAAGAEEMSAATEEQSATAEEVAAGAHEAAGVAKNVSAAVEKFRV